VLTGQIGVIFYADLTNFTEQERQDLRVSFSVAGSESTDTYDPECKSQNGEYYGFTCYINSAQMNETITATLHYGTDSTKEVTYSVQNYVSYVTDENYVTQFTAAAVSLTKATADYGHYMTYFIKDYGTGVDKRETIGCFATYSADDIAAAKAFVASKALVKSDPDGVLTNPTYALLLGSETTIRLKFKAEAGATVTVKKGDEIVDPEKITHTVDSEGNHVLKIKNINAAQLADMFEVSVTDSNGTATITVSALSYANTIFNSNTFKNNAVAMDAMTALYRFYIAAHAYTGH
jgi:hypothetical protein